ncbi:MAG: hypothetical protein BHV68_20760 [Bacteroidales bacterium 43_8]|nr:MAG: hypothetical protein BHV68_20760 [Bacteroidales bacterium 43_8]
MTDMFFFKEISGLVTAGVELNVTIKRSGENLIVSVLPKVTDLKDEAAKKLVPLVVSGTPDEAAISTPVQSATGLLTNMKEFEVSQVEAQVKSKAAEANKKKYDQLVKKADDFEKGGKLNNAIACLKQAKVFAPDKQATQKKIDKLQAKAGAGSLFEEEDLLNNYLEELPEEETEDINDKEEEDE